MTYTSAVLRETVRIALTIDVLNGLKVKVADIMHAYITAPIEEKVWKIPGHEFGVDAGRKAVIVCELNCLKSSSAAFPWHLADYTEHMGYKS